jgi:hypothetical protein
MGELIQGLIKKPATLKKAVEVLEVEMEATTTIQMDGMDINTTEEIATMIMATRDTTITTVDAIMAMIATKTTTL